MLKNYVTETVEALIPINNKERPARATRSNALSIDWNNMPIIPHAASPAKNAVSNLDQMLQRAS